MDQGKHNHVLDRTLLQNYYKQGQGSLYLAFSHMDTSDLHPPTRGGGGSTERLFMFIVIINTSRSSLFKTPDTFDDTFFNKDG